MLTVTNAKTILTDAQWAAVERINRPVGGIRLHGLERIVAYTLEKQGREVTWSQDGYRSLYSPEMLDEPMARFLAPKVFRPQRSRLTAAVSRVRKQLRGLGVVRPLTLSEACNKVLEAKEDKFAGLPTMGAKGEDAKALHRASACWNGKAPPPAVIGHRGKNVRVARAVWMFPFEWHIVEAAFFYPLQEKMKAKVPVYAALNAVSRRATLNEAVSSGDFSCKIAMDYSGYDGSIGPQLIGIAFNLLEEHLQLSEHEKKVWSRVATYFATCPFVNQHGELVKGRRGGVPSGSMFTQMIDSIVNALVIEYAFLEDVGKRYYVYGDDSLILLRSGVSDVMQRMDSIAADIAHLGIRVNLAKTHVCEPSQTTTFLGHYDLKRGRPAEEVFARLLFPERPFEPTVENLIRRVVSYTAESDEAAAVLVPVYYILCGVMRANHQAVDYSRVPEGASSGITRLEMPNHGMGQNNRDLPGILQYLAGEDPSIVSAYLRIRAAV